MSLGQLKSDLLSLDQKLSYWKNRLAGAAKSVELPSDRAGERSAASSDTVSVALPLPLCRRILELADHEHTEPFNLMLAVFVVLFARYSRQEDVVIGATNEIAQPIGGALFEDVSVLRCDLAGEPTFRQLLQRLGGLLAEARAHAISFDDLVEALGEGALGEQDRSRNPIFQILFAAQGGALGNTPIPQRNAPVLWPSGTDRLDLTVVIHGDADDTHAEFRFNPARFDRASIARLGNSFLVLLDSAIAHPGSNVFTLNMLSEAERQTIVVDWNRTEVDYPRDVLLHELVEAQVQRTPDSIAVVSGSQQLTYRELNQRANQLAHRLRKHGVGPDVLVGVCAERSLEMVIALLASIKAGGAYVPLDPEYPHERLRMMLQDSDPPVVLTQAHLLDHVPASNAQVICLDRDWPSLAQESTDNPSVELSGKNLAYCIYTSGSTGKPKGVPNLHESIVNRLFWGQDTYQLTPADRVLQKTPFSFDVSVWEFFWPLITGATLVMARPGGHKDPAYLVELIQQHQITIIHFVPSMLAIFLSAGDVEQCRSLRHVLTVGEILSFELQSRFFERLKAKLHNLYGPTEAAVEVTYWECNSGYARPIVPIGKPVANTQIYVLDTHLQPVPVGVAGELHIGGVQLARGYLNRPELTAEKFIPDPFRQAPNARLYKSGDLARFLPDGNIDFMGRIDNQVKLRGFRIELGEIEVVLCECPGVRLAAVSMREDIPGDKRLVAYIVPTARQELSLDGVRAHLQETVPDFMVPSRFVILDEMPMTTSGKVDRGRLPRPQDERDDQREIIAARNHLESAILPIFRKVLGIESLGVKDDFFKLGGHSLLAARLLSEIKQVTGHQLPLSAMLHAATVESLANLVASGNTASPNSLAVQIQPGEKGSAPLFAVVIPGVETVGYAALARHLGPQRPFYTLQGQHPVPGAQPFSPSELEGLARSYIAALRSVQPQGPYHFIAMCDDVLVCEEMILQLERSGQDVGFFAILDTWPLQNTMVPWKWKIDYYSARLRNAGQLPSADWLRAGREVLERRREKESSPRSSERPTWMQVYWPGSEFQPPRFRAPVVLFKRPRQPFFYIADRGMGWGRRSLGGVELHEMDLDHENLLREPHIKTIGKILAARLQKSGKSLP